MGHEGGKVIQNGEEGLKGGTFLKGDCLIPTGKGKWLSGERGEGGECKYREDMRKQK